MRSESAVERWGGDKCMGILFAFAYFIKLYLFIYLCVGVLSESVGTGFLRTWKFCLALQLRGIKHLSIIMAATTRAHPGKGRIIIVVCFLFILYF